MSLTFLRVKCYLLPYEIQSHISETSWSIHHSSKTLPKKSTAVLSAHSCFTGVRSKVTLKLEGGPGSGWCSLHGMISCKVKALVLLFMIHVTTATQSSRQQLVLHRRIGLPNDVSLTSDLNITLYSMLSTCDRWKMLWNECSSRNQFLWTYYERLIRETALYHGWRSVWD